MSEITRAAMRLLDFIGATEAPRGYGTIYGNNQAKLPKPLTQFTLDQVIRAQPSWTRKFGSSAAGRYQFMKNTLDAKDTLKDLRGELHLTGKELFDAALQDRMAMHLLRRRGWDMFVSGAIDRTEFGKRLAMEWASFPVLAPVKGAHRMLKRGQSFYAGDKLNKALVSPAAVEAMLDDVLSLARRQPEPKAPPPPVIVEKPVVVDPGELEQSPGKSKTVWTWLLTILGTPVAVFGGLDWRVQLAIVAVIVAFGFYGIKRRFDLAKGVRQLRAAFEGEA